MSSFYTNGLQILKILHYLMDLRDEQEVKMCVDSRLKDRNKLKNGFDKEHFLILSIFMDLFLMAKQRNSFSQW